MLLIPIDKLGNEHYSIRKAREAHIIHKVKTVEPVGINKRDEHLSVTIYSKPYVISMYLPFCNIYIL